MNKNSKYYAYAEEMYVLVEPSLNNLSDLDRIKYLNFLKRYKFRMRKENEAPHPNTKKNYSTRKKGDNKSSKGLARATLRNLDINYNAKTSNNLKDSLVEIISEKHL